RLGPGDEIARRGAERARSEDPDIGHLRCAADDAVLQVVAVRAMRDVRVAVAVHRALHPQRVEDLFLEIILILHSARQLDDAAEDPEAGVAVVLPRTGPE